MERFKRKTSCGKWKESCGVPLDFRLSLVLFALCKRKLFPLQDNERILQCCMLPLYIMRFIHFMQHAASDTVPKTRLIMQ